MQPICRLVIIRRTGPSLDCYEGNSSSCRIWGLTRMSANHLTGQCPELQDARGFLLHLRMACHNAKHSNQFACLVPTLLTFNPSTLSTAHLSPCPPLKGVVCRPLASHISHLSGQSGTNLFLALRGKSSLPNLVCHPGPQLI